MHTVNLSSKNIKDFTAEDTIYIKSGSSQYPIIVLCQFISYDSKKDKVTGRAISVDTNESLYGRDIEKGWEVSNGLEKCMLYGEATENGRGFYHWFNSMGYALDPIEEYKVVENQMHITKHPSFGIIRAVRRNSSQPVNLFGTSIQHNTTIAIQISTATHDRDLNNDRFREEAHIIEIELSQNQFSEFITTMGQGEGTPCTIKYKDCKRIPDPPYKSKVDIFQEEFSAKMHNMGVDMQKGLVNALDLLKNKPSLTKGDREVIIKSMERLVSNLQSSMPFIAQQFHEQMDDVITEAKAEIEGFIEYKIRATGLAAIASGISFPTIEDKK